MQKVEVTHKTIIFTVVFLLLLRFLWIIRDLIFSLFIAFILMSALKPFVQFLTKRRVPRGVAAIFVYIIFLGCVVQIFSIAFPSLLLQSGHFFQNLPDILRRVSPTLSPFLSPDSLSSYLPNITGQFFDLVKGIFSNAVFMVTTIFFGFYFLLEENVIRKLLGRFFDEEKTYSITSLFDRVEKRVNAWFWGELVLMTIVGLMTFIGLNLIGIKYVLPLAVLAGLLEVVPNLGPVLSMIPAVIVGFSTSYFLGFAALGLYFVVQQLENNFIVPMVMRRAVGLNPIITLIALIVGGKIGGILGVVLAVPSTLFLESILIEISKTHKPTSAKASVGTSAEKVR